MPWPGQANTGLSPRGKEDHQLSLGQWQGSELGAGRVLQSKCHSPPHIYWLQLKSFWHYLFWGLRGEKEDTILHSVKSPPVPEGRLPALAAALNEAPKPRVRLCGGALGAEERAQGRRVSTGKKGALRLLKGCHRDTQTDGQMGRQPAPGGWWPATEEKGERLPGP